MKDRFLSALAILGLASSVFVSSLGAQAPSPSPAPGTGNIDDLFDSVQNDTVVTGAQPVGKPTEPTRPNFLYYGTVETQGVLGDGWNSADYESSAQSMWYYLHLKGGLDIQPAPQIRLIGSFSTYLPQTADGTMISNLNSGTTQSGMSTTTNSNIDPSKTIGIDELFIDYTIGDKVQFRGGQFVVTWGQGRIFNPGNLVSASSGGVNIKGFVSEGPVSYTGLVVANPDFFGNKAQPQPQELGLGGMAESSLGPVTGGISAYHQNITGATEDLYLRTSFWNFDIYSDLLATQPGGTGGTWYPGFLGGAYHEFDLGWKFRVDGEYWITGSPSPGQFTRNLGLGLDTDPFEGLKVNMKWMHSLTDSSGQLIFGLSSTPLPYMKVNLGIPFTYGSSNGIYVLGNADPEHRLLAFLLSVNLKFDYEKSH